MSRGVKSSGCQMPTDSELYRRTLSGLNSRGPGTRTADMRSTLVSTAEERLSTSRLEQLVERQKEGLAGSNCCCAVKHSRERTWKCTGIVRKKRMGLASLAFDGSGSKIEAGGLSSSRIWSLICEIALL
eukprot:3495538-Pleurochrysis_carterae.AAC.3